jgi:hypothetical protein
MNSFLADFVTQATDPQRTRPRRIQNGHVSAGSSRPARTTGSAAGMDKNAQKSCSSSVTLKVMRANQYCKDVKAATP